MRMPIAVFLAVAAVAAAGCSRTSDHRTTTYQTPSQTVAATQQPPARIPMTDAQIIGVLDFANQQEIQEGQVAQQRAASAAVRDFATRMQRDHAMMQQQGSNLASRLNVMAA